MSPTLRLHSPILPGLVFLISGGHCGGQTGSRDEAGAAALIAAARESPPGMLSAQEFGVHCDGKTDDTRAISLGINAAWQTGKTLIFPAGECLSGSISLPTEPASENRMLRLRGAGSQITPEKTRGKTGGTRLRFTGKSSTSFLAAESKNFSNPTYDIADLSLAGPDLWQSAGKGDVPLTSTSGSALKFSGKAVPRLLLRNINISGFYGEGTAALWVSNAEDSSLYDLFISNVDRCAYFSDGFNASTVANLSCSHAMSDGVLITNSESLNWIGGLFQGNRLTGLHLRGVVGSQFASVHFENNDWSQTKGEGAIKIEAVYLPPCGATRKCLSNQNIVFVGGVFNTSTDRLIALGGGPGGWSNSNITLLHGYANGVSAPFLTLGEYSFEWRIVGIVGVDASGEQIRDSGKRNILLNGNVAVGLNDGKALDANGDIDVSKNLSVGGAAKISRLKSASGTWFVCVDSEGHLISQPDPCTGKNK